MKKYTHRIAVPASVMVDVESDNERPTAEEVDAVVGDLIDGQDLWGYDGGRVYLSREAYITTKAGEHRVKRFTVEDTVENEQEVTDGE